MKRRTLSYPPLIGRLYPPRVLDSVSHALFHKFLECSEVFPASHWKFVVHEKKYLPDCIAGEDEGKFGHFLCAVHLPVEKGNWRKNFLNLRIRGVVTQVCGSQYWCQRFMTKPCQSLIMIMSQHFMNCHDMSPTNSERSSWICTQRWLPTFVRIEPPRFSCTFLECCSVHAVQSLKNIYFYCHSIHEIAKWLIKDIA